MNHLWNLIRKELKELLTPASVIAIIVVAAVFASMGGLLGSETDKITEPLKIGVLSGDAGPYYDDAIGYIEAFYDKEYGIGSAADSVKVIPGVFAGYDDPDAVIGKMNELGVSIMLVFDSEYSANIAALAGGGTKAGKITVYWSEVDTGIFGGVPTAVVDALVSYINIRTSASLIISDYPPLVLLPVPPASNYTVFNGKAYPDTTPAQISEALQSQSFLMPILIMIIITMIGGMIISSMGNEKENKTLETLLTLPVRRTTIVSGKLIGSAIAGLIFGAVYLAGMYFYTSKVWNVGTVSLESLGLMLSVTDWIVVAMMVFLAILSALGICMILGAFVKNYKAAQTLTLPISVMAMIPMFVTMFTDFNALPPVFQAVLFAIPFTHPMMVMNNLMLGNTFTVWAGLGYLAVFALLMIYITVRIYRSDILLTGLVKKKKGKRLSL